ncbi:hypothetical protein NOVO_02525 [Rickettsiales bacterium Ac37b]|nr:hypothetical protein NOVO_02525 [Rickettsiales bacterium Ac37b]
MHPIPSDISQDQNAPQDNIYENIPNTIYENIPPAGIILTPAEA